MREVVKRPLAKQDLKGIWHYSYEQWGETQATHHLEQLERGMKRLTDNPETGRSRERMRLGYRSWQIAQHVIFYTVEAGRISIRRVPHTQMDLDSNL